MARPDRTELLARLSTNLCLQLRYGEDGATNLYRGRVGSGDDSAMTKESNEEAMAKESNEEAMAKENNEEARSKESSRSSLYTEPSDFTSSSDELPPSGYSLEVIKDGVIASTLPLDSKRVVVLGRHPECDVHLNHPSLSRHHAVLQYKSTHCQQLEPGFYLYDLDSTHGTFHNKKRCFSKRYYRLHVGHAFKLGLSTRLFVLTGPDDDMEEESSLTATQLMKQAQEKKLMEKIAKERSLESTNQPEEEDDKRGVTWGMPEDAVDEEEDYNKGDHSALPDMSLNPFGSSNSKLDLDDPKRTLRMWFEREGQELEFKCEEKGYASFRCTVTLPLDTGPVVAEATVKRGKKKEAIVQCALEACRILDQRGVLRESKRVSRKERPDLRRMEEDEFYASDEDNFLDRTGTIEAKRQRRMKRHGIKDDQNIDDKKKVEALTYDKALEKRESVDKKICELQLQVKDLEEKGKDDGRKEGADDDLDSYMSSLQKSDDREKAKRFKVEILGLQMELKSLDKLILKLKPTTLDLPKPSEVKESTVGKSSRNDQFKMPSLPTKRSMSSKENTIDLTDKIADETSDSKEEESPKKENKSSSETGLHSSKETEESSPKLLSASVRIIGPSRPSATITPDIARSITSQCSDEPKNDDERQDDIHDDKDHHLQKRVRKDRGRRRQHKDEINKFKDDYDGTDPRFATWVPPKDQTGDGTTSLNKKLGY